MTDPNEEKWQKLVKTAFEAAGLPEVAEDQLEPGTYTNAQIAEKLRSNPARFVRMLMEVSELGNQAEKRSTLSFAVDLIEDI